MAEPTIKQRLVPNHIQEVPVGVQDGRKIIDSTFPVAARPARDTLYKVTSPGGCSSRGQRVSVRKCNKSLREVKIGDNL
jgi:hypothetical protein